MVFPERIEQDASSGEERSILGYHKEHCSVCLPGSTLSDGAFCGDRRGLLDQLQVE